MTVPTDLNTKFQLAEPKKESVPIPNPYNPHNKNTGSEYYNKSVIEKLKRQFTSDAPEKILFIVGKAGSGKSSTMNRIKNNPDELGTEFIPIYIDLKEIITDSNDNFLFRLFENLKNSIDQFIFPSFMEQMETIKEDITHDDIRKFFNTLEKVKDSNALILLIIDDFDRVFDTENIYRYLHTIAFFKNLATKKKQLRVLIGRSGDIPEKIKVTKFGGCLKKIGTLKIGTFDKGDFFDMIREPVKGRVTYTADALEEIKRITDGNLYLQQLICHYVIVQLNKSKKVECDKADVDKAAELIINDRRDDFEHFWERLGHENQMVCAALVDDNIVEKRENLYVIKKESLLEKIFAPKTLSTILNQLHKNDFIQKPVDGRRFSKSPFKIPLYESWIRKKYPFEKMVVEDIENIAQKNAFDEVGKIVEKISAQSLFLLSSYKNAFACTQKWSELFFKLSHKGRIERDDIQDLMDLICLNIGVPYEKVSSQDSDYFRVDVKELNIGSIEEAFFLVQDRLRMTDSDVHHFMDLIGTDIKSFRPCIFFCFKADKRIAELEERSFLNILRMNGDDIKNAIFTNRSRQVFKEFLLKRLSTSQISPYQTEGPTISNFFGRHKELQHIISSRNTNFTIVGARKIGKSSLIMRAKIILEKMGCQCIYMSLEVPLNPNYKTFLQNFEIEFYRITKARIKFNGNLNDFYLEMKLANLDKKRFVIILDEIDELLIYDKNNRYELIRVLRSLSNEGYCQVILSGFKELYNFKRNLDSPLYNFGEEKKLGPLEKKYALELITLPMQNIGITYYGPDDRMLILEYTSCHPNLLQFFCKKLVDKISEKIENNRVIYRQDIEELFNSEYDSYVLDDFYMFYNGLYNLEKLILYILIAGGTTEEKFSIASLSKMLLKREVNLPERLIKETLQQLVLRFILIEKGEGKYVFALKPFPAMLKKQYDPELLKRLIIRVKNKEYENETD